MKRVRRTRRTRRTKVPALLLALALSLTTVTPALAAPGSAHMTVTKPKDKAVYYIGESIPVAAAFTKYELGPDYEEVSAFDVTLWRDHLSCWDQELVDDPYGDPPSALFAKGNTYQYKASIPTTGRKTGAYCLQFGFFGHLADTPSVTGTGEEGPEDVDEWVELDLTLKQLKAPGKLKAAAGRKQVTVSYQKAGGAKQYAIYRSAKEKSGYKQVAATTKTKYVDKKVKAGQRYYYKVVSLRGKVKSGATAPKRSGKVLADSRKASAGTVYYTASGKCYHRKSCATLKRSRKIYKTTVKKAKARKLRACKVCKP